MANSGWVGVDLDGTLAVIDGWKGEDHIGEPVEAMIGFVRALLDRGYDVRVFTARVASVLGPERVKKSRRLIQDWCIEHLGRPLEVTAEKDFSMIALYDDRAYQVEANTGRILGVGRR